MIRNLYEILFCINHILSDLLSLLDLLEWLGPLGSDESFSTIALNARVQIIPPTTAHKIVIRSVNEVSLANAEITQSVRMFKGRKPKVNLFLVLI